MVLLKWTSGDTITERSANNKGIRKGATSDITAIVAGDLEIGDHFYNQTEQCTHVLIKKSPDKFANIKTLIGADSTEVSILGVTPTQVKDIDFIKSDEGFRGNIITIVCSMKNSDAGSNATVRVRKDGGGSDELVLQTASTSYVTKTGQIDISADANAVKTLEFFLESGNAGHTAFLKQLEIWGV